MAAIQAHQHDDLLIIPHDVAALDALFKLDLVEKSAGAVVDEKLSQLLLSLDVEVPSCLT